MGKMLNLKRNKTTNTQPSQCSQQKRVHVNNDSIEKSPLKSPLKKPRKSIDVEASSSTNTNDQMPISWETANTSVDCKLKIACDPQMINQQDASLSFKSNEIKMDQMLSEFHKKLQFDGLSTKESDKDSGNEASNNEFDELLNDSLAIDDSKFKELEKQMQEKKSSPLDQSKESGVSSCMSLDLNKQLYASPIVRRFCGSQEERLKTSDFKIPETPAKGSLRFNTTLNVSNQFNSTPKVVSRQASKLNQSLHFQDISPIKSSEASNSYLVNIRQEGKRPLNESISQEGPSCKRRNGRILFGTTTNKQQTSTYSQQQQQQTNNRQQQNNNEDEMDDDSFDKVLSQIDDKVLFQTSKPLRKVTPPSTQPSSKNRPQSRTTNNYQTKTNTQSKLGIHSQPQFKPNTQQLRTTQSQSASNNQAKFFTNTRQPQSRPMNQQVASPSFSQPVHANRSSLNWRTPSSLSSTQSSTTSTMSSIQYTDVSSTLFAKDSSKKQSHNLNANVKPTNQTKNELPKNESKSQQENDIYLMEDEDADFICSQAIAF